MNWRARPLASHDVVIASIAATTTRTGLRVHAELDTATYPTGIKISDTDMDGLPLHRHDWHGDWNYTLHPLPPLPPTPVPPPTRGHEHPDWAHPALTGLDTPAWQHLLTTITNAHQTRHDADLGARIRHGNPPTRKPAGGHPPALTTAEQTLTTVLRQRFRTPQPVLAELFGVVTATIAKAERQTRPLLQQHHPTIEPAITPLRTLTALTTHARAYGIELTPKPKPTR